MIIAIIANGLISARAQAGFNAFLPLVAGGEATVSTDVRINAPYFPEANLTEDRFGEMAIFWFGQVDRDRNYTDVRLAYNDVELTVYAAVFDRRLWYAETPDSQTLVEWDAVRLYLAPAGATVPYRFTAQFTPFAEPEERGDYQRVERRQGSTWLPAEVAFTTRSGWRGESWNDDGDDRGWVMTFHIPFASLGLSGPPAEGETWRVALSLHDRDSQAGPAQAVTTWPTAPESTASADWAILRFGLPVYTPPEIDPAGALTIRRGLAEVRDAGVGGHTVCGEGVDFWSEWGDTPLSHYNQEKTEFNVQNQSDISDWPCFSKVYLTFPLDGLPVGAQILSASLSLHQFGNSGAAGQAYGSVIQVLTVDGPVPAEDEPELTWNSGPMVSENVGRAWVDPLEAFPGWPGVERTWDLTYAVVHQLSLGGPLNLALYSADSPYHSGKYFVSSYTGDWNAVGRPTLSVTWGQ